MKKRKADWSGAALFVLYAAVMIYLLFLQRMGMQTDMSYAEQIRSNCNLIPGSTIARYVRAVLRVLRGVGNPIMIRYAAINLVGNIVVFIPLGLFLPGLFPKQRRFWRFLLTVAALIVVVEVVQLLTFLGSCDVDDLILNVVGASIGYCFFKRVEKREKLCYNKKNKKRRLCENADCGSEN